MTGLRRFRTAVNVVRAAQRFGNGAVESTEQAEKPPEYETYVDDDTGQSYRYNLTTQSTRWLDVTAAPRSELDL